LVLGLKIENGGIGAKEVKCKKGQIEGNDGKWGCICWVLTL